MKIIIVDDHEIILESLSMLIASIEHVEVLAVFSEANLAVEFLKNNPIDIVITDYDMPDMTGIEFTIKVRELFQSKFKILMLTVSEEAHVIKDAFKAGISGYVMKKANRAELETALNTIYSGKKYFSDSVIFELLNPEMAPSSLMELEDEYSNALTQREIEIIKLISEECSSLEISNRLFISQSTVETHRHNILKKLNVKNSIGVIKYAMKYGLVNF